MVIYTRDESEEAVGQFGHRRRESEVSRSRAEMAIEFADRAILVPAQRASAKTAAVGKRQLIFEFARVLNDPGIPRCRSERIAHKTRPLAGAAASGAVCEPPLLPSSQTYECGR